MKGVKKPTFDDLVEVKCKKCGSTNVDLMPNYCDLCGNYIDSYCNSCKASYKHPD